MHLRAQMYAYIHVFLHACSEDCSRIHQRNQQLHRRSHLELLHLLGSVCLPAQRLAIRVLLHPRLRKQIKNCHRVATSSVGCSLLWTLEPKPFKTLMSQYPSRVIAADQQPAVLACWLLLATRVGPSTCMHIDIYCVHGMAGAIHTLKPDVWALSPVSASPKFSGRSLMFFGCDQGKRGTINDGRVCTTGTESRKLIPAARAGCCKSPGTGMGKGGSGWGETNAAEGKLVEVKLKLRLWGDEGLDLLMMVSIHSQRCRRHLDGACSSPLCVGQQGETV